MKDRIYNVLDAATIQQHGLRKPEYPFKTAVHVQPQASNPTGLPLKTTLPVQNQFANQRNLSQLTNEQPHFKPASHPMSASALYPPSPNPNMNQPVLPKPTPEASPNMPPGSSYFTPAISQQAYSNPGFKLVFLSSQEFRLGVFYLYIYD